MDSQDLVSSAIFLYTVTTTTKAKDWRSRFIFGDAFNCILIAVVAAATRLMFFGWPAQMVFDEIYSGNFFSAYARGTFFFDVHPPLARLLIYFWGFMTGAPATGLDSLKIGSAIPQSFVDIRLLPILAGVLLPVVIYGICRALKFSKISSLTVGLLIGLENSLIVQSRLVLTDVLLLLFGFSAILFYLWSRYINQQGTKHAWWGNGRVLTWLSAIMAAASASIKWTGLAFLACILCYEVFRLFVIPWIERARLSFWSNVWKLCKTSLFYVLTLIVFYVAVFALHFALLPRSGPGDPFMKPQFQMTLVGNANAGNAKLHPEGFFNKFFELNHEMFTANNSLPPTADYASKWYTWPFMIRGIFYWQGNAQYIYLLGNPLIYWLGTASIFMLLEYCLRLFVRHRPDQNERPVWKYWTLAIILAGFLINYLPFIFIGRVMFLYHYEAALIFSLIAIGFAIEMVPKGKWRLGAAIVLICLSFAFYRYFSPLIYGTHLTDKELQARMWLPSWR